MKEEAPQVSLWRFPYEGGGHMEDAGHPAEYGRSVKARFERRIEMNVPDRRNDRLHAFIERVNADDELYALWQAANVNAIERLGMTDHGPVHVKIVMNIAVKLYRLLVDGGVEPSIVTTTRWMCGTAR
jgi:metal-dependent HD superfamily phosphatase/phosphodiesterase